MEIGATRSQSEKRTWKNELRRHSVARSKTHNAACGQLEHVDEERHGRRAQRRTSLAVFEQAKIFCTL